MQEPLRRREFLLLLLLGVWVRHKPLCGRQLLLLLVLLRELLRGRELFLAVSLRELELLQLIVR